MDDGIVKAICRSLLSLNKSLNNSDTRSQTSKFVEELKQAGKYNDACSLARSRDVSYQTSVISEKLRQAALYKEADEIERILKIAGITTGEKKS